MTSWTTFTELVELLMQGSNNDSTSSFNELRFGSYKLRDLYESMHDFAIQYPQLLDAIRQNTSVTHLCLELDSDDDDATLTTAATMPFLDAFCNLPNIQSIHAECCSDDSDHGDTTCFDFKTLHRILNKLANSNNNKLTSLVLRGRNCKWTNVTDATMFATSLARISSLKKFELLEFGQINEMDNINNNNTPGGNNNNHHNQNIIFHPVVPMATTATTTPVATPPGSTVTILPLTSIILALSHLHKLEYVKISLVTDASGGVGLGDAVYSILFSSQQQQHHEQERTENNADDTSNNNNNNDDNNANAIGRLLQLPSLQELEFSGLTFDASQANAFSRYLPPSSSSCESSSSASSPSSFSSSRRSSASSSSLTTLTFYSCQFVGGCEAILFLGLQHNTSLKRLYFHWVRVDHLSFAETCSSLSLAITNNTTLSCLRLDLCSADNKCAVPQTAMLQVLQAIKVNKSLRSAGLELDGIVALYNPKDLNAVCTGIAELIRVNECLKDFNLVLAQDPSGCAKKQEDRLVVAMKENFTLEFCNIRPIQCGASSSLVDIYTRLNQDGRIYLKQGAQQARGVELLISVQHDLDCLFVHLLENPGLCCSNVSI